MDYLLQILAARNLLHRIVSMDATVDALSILPGLTVVLRAHTALRPELGLMRLMRAVRILRLRRLMQVPPGPRTPTRPCTLKALRGRCLWS
jgi:hypothetical protein